MSFGVLQVDGNKVACAVLIKDHRVGERYEEGGQRDNLKEIKWLLMTSLFVRISEFCLQSSPVAIYSQSFASSCQAAFGNCFKIPN